MSGYFSNLLSQAGTYLNPVKAIYIYDSAIETTCSGLWTRRSVSRTVKLIHAGASSDFCFVHRWDYFVADKAVRLWILPRIVRFLLGAAKAARGDVVPDG